MDRKEIEQKLRVGAEIVDGIPLASDLRSTALAAILDVLFRADSPSREVTDGAPPSSPQRSGAGSDPASVLAGRLGVTPGQLEYVIDMTGGEPTLVVGRSKLPDKKAPAMKVLTLLHAASRQGLGLEDWTPLDGAREQCRVYGVLDQPNFASSVRSAGDSLVFRKAGRQVLVKVTKPGFDEAGRLIQLFSGDGR